VNRTEGISGANRILRKAQLGPHTVRLNPHCNTLEPDRPQHDRPAACVIAQQHSSATFVSLSIHPAKKNSVFQIYEYLIASAFQKNA